MCNVLGFILLLGKGRVLSWLMGFFVSFSHKKGSISNKAVAVRIDVFGVLCAQAPML